MAKCTNCNKEVSCSCQLQNGLCITCRGKKKNGK